MKVRVFVIPTVLMARSNGWRMPSMPDDVLAETIRLALAAVLSSRNGLDCDSFMPSILPARPKKDQ